MKQIINKTVAIVALSLLSAITASAQTWTGANGTSFQTVLNTDGASGNANDTTGYGSVDYDYSIGTYEVTNSQYATFLTAVGSTTTSLGNSLYGGLNSSTYGGIEDDGNGTFSAVLGKENNAVSYVSCYAAAMYTNWLSTGDYMTGTYDFNTYGIDIDVFNPTNLDLTYDYKLPTENEWYKAAYYDPNTQTYSLYANKKDTISTVEANYNRSVGNITEVGAYADIESFYGTFDQSGNVCEWNDTIEGNSDSLGLRGGSFINYSSSLESDYRDSVDPSLESFTRSGFRVSSLAAIPEPSTYAMIFGVFALGFAYYRKRK